MCNNLVEWISTDMNETWMKLTFHTLHSFIVDIQAKMCRLTTTCKQTTHFHTYSGWTFLQGTYIPYIRHVYTLYMEYVSLLTLTIKKKHAPDTYSACRSRWSSRSSNKRMCNRKKNLHITNSNSDMQAITHRMIYLILYTSFIYSKRWSREYVKERGV
jgi:hypothetical protein